MDLYQKFELLRHSTKKECKVKQLTKNQSDPLFCFVLEFLLNTDKRTGISTKKLEKEIADKIEYQEIDSIEELINYVLKNNTGKDEVVKTVQQFLMNIENPAFKNFVQDIITKKYKCGVTAKVASEIIPDVIKKEHQVMLANKFKGEIKDPVQITLKLDGIRCSALIDENNKQAD